MLQCCQELLHQIRRAGRPELCCWKGNNQLVGLNLFEATKLQIEWFLSFSSILGLSKRSNLLISGSDEAEAPTYVGEKARGGRHWHEGRSCSCRVEIELLKLRVGEHLWKAVPVNKSQSLLCSLILRAPRWPIIVRCFRISYCATSEAPQRWRGWWSWRRAMGSTSSPVSHGFEGVSQSEL